MVLLRGIDVHDAVPWSDKPLTLRRDVMTESWFIVGTDYDGRGTLLGTAHGWSSTTTGSWFASKELRRQYDAIVDLYAFVTRELARGALSILKKHSDPRLASSARIVRVRKWSKGERTKLACDWAGIPTLENGKPISTGRRVELLAERAMGLGATVHQQRAELYTLRAANGKPAVKPAKRGNRS